jgi:hypothetical protein
MVKNRRLKLFPICKQNALDKQLPRQILLRPSKRPEMLPSRVPVSPAAFDSDIYSSAGIKGGFIIIFKSAGPHID